VANPLGTDHEVSDDTTSNALTAIAMSQPLFAQPSWALPDRALFLLSEAILTTAPEGERRLTLLHECIHLDFAFGEHRERWARIQRRISDTEGAILDMPTTTPVERQNYGELRKNVAFELGETT
jgi:hypothetical protein